MRLTNILVSLVLLLTFSGSVGAQQQWLQKLPRGEHYQRVTTIDYVALEKAFLALFQHQDAAALQSYYNITELDSAYRGVSESNLGWGVWTYQPQATYPVFLQIPHRFHDLDTRHFAHLAQQLQLAQVVMINTVPRYQGAQQQPPLNSDLSNARRSPMLAATEAWLAATPQGLVVQLHGFSQNNRMSQTAQQAEVIISHGSDQRFIDDSRLRDIQQCLQETLAVDVKRFPSQVSELGGTLNNVAKALGRWRKQTQFIHVELNRSLRERLAQQPQQAEQLLRCTMETSQ